MKTSEFESYQSHPTAIIDCQALLGDEFELTRENLNLLLEVGIDLHRWAFHTLGPSPEPPELLAAKTELRLTIEEAWRVYLQETAASREYRELAFYQSSEAGYKQADLRHKEVTAKALADYNERIKGPEARVRKLTQEALAALPEVTINRILELSCPSK